MYDMMGRDLERNLLMNFGALWVKFFLRGRETAEDDEEPFTTLAALAPMANGPLEPLRCFLRMARLADVEVAEVAAAVVVVATAAAAAAVMLSGDLSVGSVGTSGCLERLGSAGCFEKNTLRNCSSRKTCSWFSLELLDIIGSRAISLIKGQQKTQKGTY